MQPITKSLGDRMKDYEKIYRNFIPKQNYTIIRLDGKAFHTFTKGFEKPFDDRLMNMMDQAAITLCSEIQGAKFAYVQSDEISILVTDVENPQSEIWFNGNVQKITSVSASIAANAFNKTMVYTLANEKANEYQKSEDKNGYDAFMEVLEMKFANFDSRIFVPPSQIEAYNAFLWRQRDWVRNSISMTAQAKFGHSKCFKKNTFELKQMLLNEGIDWDKFDEKLKKGRLIVKKEFPFKNKYGEFMRTRWISTPAFDFSENRKGLLNLIPERS